MFWNSSASWIWLEGTYPWEPEHLWTPAKGSFWPQCEPSWRLPWPQPQKGNCPKSFLSLQPGPLACTDRSGWGSWNPSPGKTKLCLHEHARSPSHNRPCCFSLPQKSVKDNLLLTSTEGRNDYLSFLALVEHDYFHFTSLFWRMNASHGSTRAFKALFGINGQQEESFWKQCHLMGDPRRLHASWSKKLLASFSCWPEAQFLAWLKRI